MAVSYSSLPSIYFSTIILSVSRLHCQRFFLYVDSHILPNINIKERTAPFQTLAGTKFTFIYSPMYEQLDVGTAVISDNNNTYLNTHCGPFTASLQDGQTTAHLHHTRKEYQVRMQL